jgi:hypothetical protein
MSKPRFSHQMISWLKPDHEIFHSTKDAVSSRTTSESRILYLSIAKEFDVEDFHVCDSISEL